MSDTSPLPAGIKSEFRFEEKYYEEITFDKIEYPGKQIEDVEFYNCIFSGVIMAKGVLSSCIFEKCSFVNCDLSLMKIIKSSFLGIKFENCKLIGIDWTKISQPYKVSFQRCKLNDSIFFNMDLRSAEITSCEVHNAYFERADLSRADLTASDFLNSTFSGTNLSFADLTDARNYSIDPVKNNIKRAKFSLPEALNLLDPWEVLIK